MTAVEKADIDRYIAETLKFAKALNLTSVKEVGLFERRFVVPSQALCRWLPERGGLLDVGSGMGIPGIPILLRRRKLQGMLVERRKKRAEFLRHIIRLLHLNAMVYDDDIRSLTPLHADACVARAVVRPAVLLRLVLPHMAPGAVAVLPVSSKAQAADIPGWRLEGEEAVDVSGGSQRIQRYRLGGFT